MTNKFYDVVIIGCGVAGCSCAYILAKSGLKCIVLEKNSSAVDKVCGDGLSVRGVKDLSLISMDTELLLSNGGKKIQSHFMTKDNIIVDNYDYINGFAIGIPRKVLNKLLLERVLEVGAEVVFNKTVTKIRKTQNGYCVNDYYCSKAVVIASGATSRFSLSCKYGKYLPLGMSSRIKCQLPYIDNCFYINRDSIYKGGYSWLFPVGDNLWNIGVWTPDFEEKKKIKELYSCFEEKVIMSVDSGCVYDRKPEIAAIGTINSERISDVLAVHREKLNSDGYYFVGDSALLASYYSGEGISFAIESGFEVAVSIITKMKPQPVNKNN